MITLEEKLNNYLILHIGLNNAGHLYSRKLCSVFSIHWM